MRNKVLMIRIGLVGIFSVFTPLEVIVLLDFDFGDRAIIIAPMSNQIGVQRERIWMTEQAVF